MPNIDSVIDQQIEFGLTEELEVTISIPKDMQAPCMGETIFDKCRSMQTV